MNMKTCCKSPADLKKHELYFEPPLQNIALASKSPIRLKDLRMDHSSYNPANLAKQLSADLKSSRIENNQKQKNDELKEQNRQLKEKNTVLKEHNTSLKAGLSTVHSDSKLLAELSKKEAQLAELQAKSPTAQANRELQAELNMKNAQLANLLAEFAIIQDDNQQTNEQRCEQLLNLLTKNSTEGIPSEALRDPAFLEHMLRQQINNSTNDLHELSNDIASNNAELLQLRANVRQLEIELQSDKNQQIVLRQNSDSSTQEELCQQLSSLLTDENLSDIPADKRNDPAFLTAKVKEQIVAAEKGSSLLTSKMDTLESNNSKLAKQVSSSRNRWIVALAASITGLVSAVVAGAVLLSKARSAEYDEEATAAEAGSRQDFVDAEKLEYQNENTTEERKQEISGHYLAATNNNGERAPDFNISSMTDSGNQAAASSIQAAREKAIETTRSIKQESPAVALGIGGLLSLAGVIGSGAMLAKKRNKSTSINLEHTETLKQRSPLTQLARSNSSASTVESASSPQPKAIKPAAEPAIAYRIPPQEVRTPSDSETDGAKMHANRMAVLDDERSIYQLQSLGTHSLSDTEKANNTNKPEVDNQKSTFSRLASNNSYLSSEYLTVDAYPTSKLTR